MLDTYINKILSDGTCVSIHVYRKEDRKCAQPQKCPYCVDGIKETCYREKVKCSTCNATGYYNPNWMQELSVDATVYLELQKLVSELTGCVNSKHA